MDEDGELSGELKTNIVIIKQFHENFRSKTPTCMGN